MKKFQFFLFLILSVPTMSFSKDKLNNINSNNNQKLSLSSPNLPNAYNPEKLPNWLIVNFSLNELVVLDKQSISRLDDDIFVINSYIIFNQEQKFKKDISVDYFSKRLVIDCGSQNEVSFSPSNIYYAGRLLETLDSNKDGSNKYEEFDRFYKNLNFEYSLKENQMKKEVWQNICRGYNFKNENGELSISFDDQDINKVRESYRYMIKHGN